MQHTQAAGWSTPSKASGPGLCELDERLACTAPVTLDIPGPDRHFLINPYDLIFEEITASSLVKIDLDGNPVEPTEHKVNPAGFTILSAIHMAREDATAVMHLHTPCGQAVSGMKEGLLPHTQTAMLVAEDVAYHEYEGLSTDLDERERLVQDLGERHVMILRNHGTLAVGRSIPDCYLRLYFLERSCEAQVLMLAGGRDNLNNPPQGVEHKVSRQANPKDFGLVARSLAWPALLRKLDRLDPSYRD